MIYINGSASSRKTDIGGLVESFIDDNVNDLSANVIGLLESLAEEVDSQTSELEKIIEQLQDHEEYLLNRIEELEEEN